MDIKLNSYNKLFLLSLFKIAHYLFHLRSIKDIKEIKLTINHSKSFYDV